MGGIINPSSSFSGPQGNYTATTSPAATNDNTQGYSIGSLWVNINSGVIWICRDATTNAAAWVRKDNADFFGYVANRYYIDNQAIGSSSNAMVVGTIRLYPVIIKERHTIDTLGVRIVGTGTGNVQVAQYASNPSTKYATGTPLVSTASMSTATAGIVSGAAAASFEAGLYWMAVIADNATATAIAINNSATAASGLIGSATAANINSTNTAIVYSVPGQTFGTWPDMTSVTPTETPGTVSLCWAVHRHVSAVFG